MRRTTTALALLLVTAAAAACSSSDTDARKNAPITKCVRTATLAGGETPAGTDLCLGATGTFRVAPLRATAPTGTVTVAVTAITKGSDADLRTVAATIPKDVDPAKNDMYYVRATVTLTAATTPGQFRGEDPLEAGFGIVLASGRGTGYVGVHTDSCPGAADFATGLVGDTYTKCETEFVPKGATPVGAGYVNTTAGHSYDAKPVRWAAA